MKGRVFLAVALLAMVLCFISGCGEGKQDIENKVVANNGGKVVSCEYLRGYGYNCFTCKKNVAFAIFLRNDGLWGDDYQIHKIITLDPNSITCSENKQ